MSKLMLRTPIVKEVYPPNEFSALKPADDMVVTINKDGSPRSIFRDDTWDYSATSSTVRLLNFRAKIECIIQVDGVKLASTRSSDTANEFLKILTLHWISALGGCSMSKLNGDVTAISSWYVTVQTAGFPQKKSLLPPTRSIF